ncbi:MAG: UDP-N-acetylmuramate--L-alanine ligase [Frankia sp.]
MNAAVPVILGAELGTDDQVAVAAATEAPSGRHVHLLGIGGTGMSPLARVCLGRGDEVTGSDALGSPRVEALQALGARIRVGPSRDLDRAELEKWLIGADLVVASSALPADDPELLAARELGIPVRKRSQWLPEVTAGHDLVAVAGSHGKSTTASMLTVVLRDGRLDPTAVIGAEVEALGGNAVVGAGRHFVLEADEYDGAFAGLDPYLAIITNVEWEHPDLFADEAAVRAAFTAFAARIRPDGYLIVCADDPGARAVAATLPDGGPRVVSYGIRPLPAGRPSGLGWRATDIRADGSGGSFASVLRGDEPVGTLRLRLPGAHNVANALAVVAAASELGVPLAVALQSLSAFAGAARRFQVVGTADAGADGRRGPVEVVDDYAHHPTEIAATLAAARSRAGDRAVWAVIQPHTFSRLAALMDGFATAFSLADRVYVTDIYAAREHDDLGLHGADLARRIVRPTAVYTPDADLLDRLVSDLADGAPAGALVLTLGAGDITDVGPRLLAAL